MNISVIHLRRQTVVTKQWDAIFDYDTQKTMDLDKLMVTKAASESVKLKRSNSTHTQVFTIAVGPEGTPDVITYYMKLKKCALARLEDATSRVKGIHTGKLEV